MAKLPIVGVETVKMGAAGANGAMGASLDSIGAIVENSVALNTGDVNRTEIIPDDYDDPLTVIKQNGSKTIEFATYDLSNEIFETAFGGTVAAGKWTAPSATFEMGEQSIEITSRTKNGKKHKFEFYKCDVTAQITGNLSKTGALSVKFMATILTPTDAGGANLPSWAKTEV